MLPFAHTTRRTRTGRSEKKQPCLQFAGSWGYVRKSQHTDSHSRMAFLCVLVPVRGAPVPCQCLCYARGRFAASPRWDLCGLLVPVRAPVRCLKRKKESREPKEGWEDGTPPPHRDFKERECGASRRPPSGVYLFLISHRHRSFSPILAVAGSDPAALSGIHATVPSCMLPTHLT